MRQHGILSPPTNLQLTPNTARSIYALYWRDDFLGSCVAIANNILITAGHHFNSNKDDVGDFTVQVKDSQWARVEYASKDRSNDVLLLWLQQPVVYFTDLRGFLPPLNARVATVWLSPKPPHHPIVSPGVVVESDEDGCTVKGTVSTTGSSGAPVLDFLGERVVGLHLTSNTKNGSRVSGFIPARKLVSLLAEMGVPCRQ